MSTSKFILKNIINSMRFMSVSVIVVFNVVDRCGEFFNVNMTMRDRCMIMANDPILECFCTNMGLTG